MPRHSRALRPADLGAWNVWRGIFTGEHGVIGIALCNCSDRLFVSIPATSISIGMAKRELHIVRNELGNLQFGICERCGQTFLALGDIWGVVEDFLRRKFEEHKCSREDDERIIAQSDEAA